PRVGHFEVELGRALAQGEGPQLVEPALAQHDQPRACVPRGLDPGVNGLAGDRLGLIDADGQLADWGPGPRPGAALRRDPQPMGGDRDVLALLGRDPNFIVALPELGERTRRRTVALGLARLERLFAGLLADVAALAVFGDVLGLVPASLEGHLD